MAETAKSQLRAYFRENPNSTNAQVATDLNMNEGTVKAELSRMNRTGQVLITRVDGVRTVKVVYVEVNGNASYKRETYRELADRLIEANAAETNSAEIRKNTRVIITLLAKL